MATVTAGTRPGERLDDRDQPFERQLIEGPSAPRTPSERGDGGGAIRVIRNSRSRPVRWRTRSTPGCGPDSWTSVWTVGIHVMAEGMEGAPSGLGVDRRFAVHDPHDRAERDQPRARQEGQVRQVDQQGAAAPVVEGLHLVDEALEVRRVEFAVEGRP